jgi:hypothetical protein
MRFRVGFLLRDIPNKDVPTQESRRSFGRAIVNKASLLYGGILSPAFNRLPVKGRDTRIGSAGSTQRQTFGSCADRNTPIGTQVPRTVLTLHSFRSEFHLGLASSSSYVDDAQGSLRALQESADASPNPHLKSAVSGVSALWQIAKVEQCVVTTTQVYVLPNFVACGTLEKGSASLVGALTQSIRNLG